ncbi:universal stress protein [Rhodopila sp.]|uniref:universal stress protein n=1 Tax=Rhodopila sp. TaxID=2480087 RepID=UPI003D0B8C12
MTYSTLMVNLELGQSNSGLLGVTNELAKRFGAAVIGIAARQPMQIVYADGCYVSPELIDDEREEIDKELGLAEAEFRDSVNVPNIQWRSRVSFEPPSDYVVKQARRADLLLTGMPSRNRADSTRLTASELVMQSGRPVLVAPKAPVRASLERVVLGWKDTRETRRAALDAVPLMKRAKHVTVIEIAADEDLAEARERLTDVAHWLNGHGIAAETLASRSTDDDAHQLNALAHAEGADLIVAGAYGHSRLREWALGGVTRDLLLRADCCTLLSH